MGDEGKINKDTPPFCYFYVIAAKDYPEGIYIKTIFLQQGTSVECRPPRRHTTPQGPRFATLSKPVITTSIIGNFIISSNMLVVERDFIYNFLESGAVV